jgi:hypothetical protein
MEIYSPLGYLFYVCGVKFLYSFSSLYEFKRNVIARIPEQSIVVLDLAVLYILLYLLRKFIIFPFVTQKMNERILKEKELSYRITSTFHDLAFGMGVDQAGITTR